MEDSELLGVISGNGGVQVDVVLYLLNPGKSSHVAQLVSANGW
jgi:hypothetical protein